MGKIKLNKKGFTLIELLAVIVILAILILLAMPSVLSIMENARKNSLVTEAESIINAAKTAYTTEIMNSDDANDNVTYELGNDGGQLKDYVDKDFNNYSGTVIIQLVNGKARYFKYRVHPRRITLRRD